MNIKVDSVATLNAAPGMDVSVGRTKGAAPAEGFVVLTGFSDGRKVQITLDAHEARELGAVLIASAFAAAGAAPPVVELQAAPRPVQSSLM